jgi:hypothetical protein
VGRNREADHILAAAGSPEAFETVGKLIGLKKKITPRGMRWTSNDLIRVVNVDALVTRSISGHATEAMRARYSTVSPDEQRAGIGRVLRLVHSAPNAAVAITASEPASGPGGASGGASDPPSGAIPKGVTG